MDYCLITHLIMIKSVPSVDNSSFGVEVSVCNLVHDLLMLSGGLVQNLGPRSNQRGREKNSTSGYNFYMGT